MNRLYLVLLLGVLTAHALVFPIQKLPDQEIVSDLAERQEIVAVQGNIPTFGGFWIPVSLGEPAKEFNLLIDTGVTDTMVYATGCSNCQSGVEFYTIGGEVVPCDRSACSGCAREGTLCSFNTTFASLQSVAGIVVRDTVGIGSLSAERVLFGAIERVGRNFTLPGLSGVLGLAFEALSDFGAPPVVGPLTEEAGLPDTFSMCLKPNNATMTIGEAFSEDPAFVWTNVTVGDSDIRQGFFSVQVTSIQAVQNATDTETEGTELQPEESIAVVDSGTTGLWLREFTYNNFKSLLNESCENDPLVGVCESNETLFDNFCYTMTEEDIAKFPSLSFMFEGIDEPLAIPPSAYLVPLVSGGRTFQCLGILTAPDLGAHTIGQVFLQQFHVAFDRDLRRVGFASLDTCLGEEPIGI